MLGLSVHGVLAAPRQVLAGTNPATQRLQRQIRKGLRRFEQRSEKDCSVSRLRSRASSACKPCLLLFGLQRCRGATKFGTEFRAYKGDTSPTNEEVSAD